MTDQTEQTETQAAGKPKAAPKPKAEPKAPDAPCEACNGTGHIKRDVCGKCEGTGLASKGRSKKQ